MPAHLFLPLISGDQNISQKLTLTGWRFLPRLLWQGLRRLPWCNQDFCNLPETARGFPSHRVGISYNLEATPPQAVANSLLFQR
jgi:hypothetical protein